MKLIEKIGFYGIELIEEQIEKGIDIEGKPYHYSTRPFKMPVSNKLVGFKNAITAVQPNETAKEVSCSINVSIPTGEEGYTLKSFVWKDDISLL